MLREGIPQLRTAGAILKKNEQVLDGMEHGAITPKMAEQMSQCTKMPITLARFEMAYIKMVTMMGRKAVVPRSSLLRSMIPGLDPEKLSPGDGDVVRKLLPEGE